MKLQHPLVALGRTDLMVSRIGFEPRRLETLQTLTILIRSLLNRSGMLSMQGYA